ncbi:hypothetical protein BH11BAC3_BH11BAC3_38230 [soil metagenome]
MIFSKKYIGIFCLLITVVIGVYFYHEYQRKLPDFTQAKPAIEITVAMLMADYENDETKANEQYLGKPIQVSGLITEIINQQDTLVNIFLGDANSLHNVSCLLGKSQVASVKNYRQGQAVIIKGICTGYLMDVELNRCVIVEKNE